MKFIALVLLIGCLSPQQSQAQGIEKYKEQFGFKGDLNSDQKVTVADTRLLLELAISSNQNHRLIADINSDGRIDINDAIQSLQIAVGLRPLTTVEITPDPTEFFNDFLTFISDRNWDSLSLMLTDDFNGRDWIVNHPSTKSSFVHFIRTFVDDKTIRYNVRKFIPYHNCFGYVVDIETNHLNTENFYVLKTISGVMSLKKSNGYWQIFVNASWDQESDRYCQE